MKKVVYQWTTLIANTLKSNSNRVLNTMSSKQKAKPSTPSKTSAGSKRKSKAVEQTSKKLKKSEHATESEPAASNSKRVADNCVMRDRFGKLVFEDYPEFRPNMTPKEVLQAGSFGGTYFRPISSKVTGKWFPCVTDFIMVQYMSQQSVRISTRDKNGLTICPTPSL